MMLLNENVAMLTFSFQMSNAQVLYFDLDNGVGKVRI